MADQILNAVIELENRIEQQLQQEQLRAETWLESLRHEEAAKLNRGLQQIRQTEQQLLRTAEREIAQQAEQILKSEMDYCRRLEGISDQELLEVLGRQLDKILPRHANDHQNGES